MAVSHEEVLDYIRKNPGLTEVEIATGLYGDGAYQQQVNRVIAELRSGGRVRREGFGGRGDAYRAYAIPDVGDILDAAASEAPERKPPPLPGKSLMKYMDARPDALAGLQREIGRVSMLWAKLHNDTYELFRETAGLDQDAASIIFGRVPSDKVQRLITKDMALRFYREDEPRAARVKHIFDTLEKLAPDRNDAVHTDFGARREFDPETHEPYLVHVASQVIDRKRPPPPGSVEHFSKLADQLLDVHLDFNVVLLDLYTRHLPNGEVK